MNASAKPLLVGYKALVLIGSALLLVWHAVIKSLVAPPG